MIYLLTLVVVATRFLPHPPNVACLGALGLFAGCYVSGWRAYLLPAVALLLSDVVGQLLGIAGMGFYNPTVMLATYAGLTLSVPLGRVLRRSEQAKGIRWLGVPFAAVGASTLFFLVSNFGVWLGPWYSADLAGLARCYANAIPFYGYTLAGDLCFAGLMFGANEWASVQGRPRFQLGHALASLQR